MSAGRCDIPSVASGRQEGAVPLLCVHARCRREGRLPSHSVSAAGRAATAMQLATRALR
jgi:hypothetical protein